MKISKIFENVKSRVQWLVENQEEEEDDILHLSKDIYGEMPGVFYTTSMSTLTYARTLAICEELERMTKRIKEIEERLERNKCW